MADKAHAEPELQLPAPVSGGDDPLLAALQRRRTTREISAKPLPLQLLSNLLWAAFGVNREAGPFGAPGRTAGSASNSQEIDVYLALAAATYRYDAADCRLVLVCDGDVRASAMTPGQPDVTAAAPVHLIYVVTCTGSPTRWGLTSRGFMIRRSRSPTTTSTPG